MRSTKGGVTYDSVTRTVNTFALGTPTFAFSSAVDDGSDFVLNGLSVSIAAGFSSPALQTPHNYPNGLNATAMLTTPIRVGANSTLSFDEIALIEPGEPGSAYGDFEFWDYAVVEGSSDGLNWVALIDGWDARADNVWLNAYNGGQAGSPAMVRNRVIPLTPVFGIGETILLRFRFFADEFVTGWGWWVDNVVVDPGAFTAADVPTALVLEQNVPNPFNPKTSIAFSVPTSAKVSLRVYDVRGRLVRTLVDEVRGPGRHVVDWDGRDDAGVQAASGVYLYRLVNGERTVQKKMSLLK